MDPGCDRLWSTLPSILTDHVIDHSIMGNCFEFTLLSCRYQALILTFRRSKFFASLFVLYMGMERPAPSYIVDELTFWKETRSQASQEPVKKVEFLHIFSSGYKDYKLAYTSVRWKEVDGYLVQPTHTSWSPVSAWLYSLASVYRLQCICVGWDTISFLSHLRAVF